MADPRYEAGIRERRAVLGDAAVSQAMESGTKLSADFQDLVTRFAWGDVWSRPGLTRKMRSAITVGMLIALNRNEELRTHLRGALNVGITVDELREVLLHAMVYCGGPAANTAFRIADEVLAEKTQSAAGS
jgi:4-carboxymuconolactone decarboxylase